MTDERTAQDKQASVEVERYVLDRLGRTREALDGLAEGGRWPRQSIAEALVALTEDDFVTHDGMSWILTEDGRELQERQVNIDITADAWERLKDKVADGDDDEDEDEDEDEE
jgi:hypothetical protein